MANRGRDDLGDAFNKEKDPAEVLQNGVAKVFSTDGQTGGQKKSL